MLLKKEDLFMRKASKVLSAVLASAMVLSLAACGGGAGDTPTAAVPSEPQLLRALLQRQPAG